MKKITGPGKKSGIWDILFAILKPTKRRERFGMTMRQVRGHVEVYDELGRFLFSADDEREAREMLEE